MNLEYIRIQSERYVKSYVKFFKALVIVSWDTERVK